MVETHFIRGAFVRVIYNYDVDYIDISKFLPDLSSICTLYSGVLSGRSITCALLFAEKDIATQQKKPQEASDELKEASNSYEMTPFKGMTKEEAAVLELRVDKLTAEYQKEKIRVCYLINQISEKIEEKERLNKWIGAMLRITGIEPDYYRSKYREPISDLPSKKE